MRRTSKESAPMLPGRESLRRLIGKPKRTYSPVVSRLLNLAGAGAGDGSSDQSAPEKAPSPQTQQPSVLSIDSEYVACPVCGVSIRGNDYAVNSHLDLCLTKGTNRKTPQRTLFDLCLKQNSSRKRSLEEASVLERNMNIIDGDTKTRDLGDNKRCDIYISDMHSFVQNASENYNSLNSSTKSSGIYISDMHDSIQNDFQNDNSLELSNISSNNPRLHAHSQSECVGGKGSMSCKVVDPTSSLDFIQSMNICKPCSSDASESVAGLTLETFIVGRKFHKNVELQEGVAVSILRDPENVKDQNAIKVLSADSKQMLGYLPRELAKYISLLMDKHYVPFKGYVLSLPTHPLDAVPLQLACQSSFVGEHEASLNDGQTIEHIWDDCLRVAKHAKANPPSLTKYQYNFRLLIEHVVRHQAHLFTDDEKLFLESFLSLSDDGQRLFIRLYTRKGPWFRMSSISYPEISNSQKAVEDLQLTGYIYSLCSDEEVFRCELQDILNVLNVFELRDISNLLLSKKGVNGFKRHEIVSFLLSSYNDGTCSHLPKIILERAGICVKIASAAELLFWRVQRLFFLNGEQDLSSFLLVDLGLIKFPTYKCNITKQIFQSRDNLLAYEEAIEVAQIMDQSLDQKKQEMVNRCIDISLSRLHSFSEEKINVCASGSILSFFDWFTAPLVYSKVISLGVSVCERDRRYEEAIRLLKQLLSRITCGSRRGYWTLRLSIDLEHLGFINESLSVSEEGVLDPWTRAGSKMALQRRVLRLGKPPRRWKLPTFAESVRRKIKEISIQGTPLISEAGTKNLFYGYDCELCGVEQLALQYYAGEGGGWQGVHSESGIWMTLFGILMWDVIFSDVPDVFRTGFQTAPLDLITDNFYFTRKGLIESLLQKICEGHAEELLITSWESHLGTACTGVNWERHSLTDLRAVVSCIGGHCLSSFCRHLALDYRSWSRGMPDLLLWRFYGGERVGGEAKLVEVKGPRDRLSEQQRAWLLILADCGFDTEVCKIGPISKLKLV